MVIKNFSTTSKNDIKSIAIGGFDGVHYAHQKLIDELYDGCIVIIETGYANITPSFDRVDYIKIPILFFELDDIKDLSGKEFISKLIEIFPKLETIVVGYDFHFGKNRASGAYDLTRFFSGAVKIINEVILDNISVHSKTIREYIKSGDIKSANKLLNHKFKIKGDVIKGQGLGSKEFVPTINIYTKEYILPKDGVYLTQSIIDNITYNSITFIGHRVSTDGSFAVETHILQEFNSCCKKIEIEFIKRVRDNQKFIDFHDLKERIFLDIDIALDYFVTAM